MDNLLSNARKYSKSGTLINVTVKNTEDTLIIKMINEVEKGLNIDFKTMQMKFRRGDLSRNRVVNSGSGLGLTIVNDIVKHLNGNFNIYEYESKVCAEVIFKIQ
ncbi:ATP-binding protein [Anaerococcus provencensis]|uniref:ATP-binding protein n=1 Tax=Anaerococcus provencensis TaxID=938293 RepID=UPI001E51BBDC|nr:ATP-binding protein [Anaerococcus provencensis]